MPGGPDGPIGGIGMASKLIGTVARSLHMAAAPQQDLVQQVIEAVTAATAQEGVILHRRDTVGVPHALPRQHGLSEDSFGERLQQALLQATGVQLNVMLYSEVVDAGHSLCSLCTLTAGKSAKESIVLIQGAEL